MLSSCVRRAPALLVCLHFLLQRLKNNPRETPCRPRQHLHLGMVTLRAEVPSAGCLAEGADKEWRYQAHLVTSRHP